MRQDRSGVRRNLSPNGWWHCRLGSGVWRAYRRGNPCSEATVTKARQMASDKDKKRKPRPKCNICGGFLTTDGRCPKVFWDDYAGANEHE